MPTLAPGKSLGEVAEIIHAAVVLGPAAWGREPMPEAHMAADIEDKLKAQLIELFRILHERKIPPLYRQRRRAKVALYENDLQMLYDLTRPQLEPLFQELEPFVDDPALADLRAIVVEMQQRIQRMDKAGK